MTFRSEHDNKDRTQRPPFIKILIGKYKFKCVVTGHNVTSTTKEQRNKIHQPSSLFSFIQRFLTEAQCVMKGGTRITTGGREQLPGAGRTPRRCCAGARRCYSCPGCSSTPPSTLRSPAHPSYTPANRARLYLVLHRFHNRLYNHGEGPY